MSVRRIKTNGNIHQRKDTGDYFGVVWYVDDDGKSSSKLSVTKNRLTGKLLKGNKALVMAYSSTCRRVVEINDMGSLNKAYGWENKTAPEGFEALQDDAECPF